MDKALNSLFFQRHSIRRYTDQDIDPEAVKQILEAALLSPSSKSARPWEFVLVEDKNTLAQLSKCKKIGSIPLRGAKLAIVVCADPEKSDVFVEDCSVATAYMHIQAAALGVGSCWIQIRNRFSADDEPAQDIVQTILGIPPHLQVVAILTLGMSAENRKPVDPSKLMWEKVHIGTYAPAPEVSEDEQA